MGRQIMMAATWGIIIATGKPEEFGAGVDPAFLTLGSKPVLMHSLSAFEQCPDIEGLVLLASKERLDSVRAMVQMFGCYKVKRLVPIAARLATLVNVVQELKADKVTMVTLHEGLRPLVTAHEISETIKMARKHGAAILGDKLADPVRYSLKGTKLSDPGEEGTAWACHSPQSFKLENLSKALQAAHKKKAVLRDEADAVSMIRGEIHVVPSTRASIRITGPRDLVLADEWLRR